VQIFCTAQMAKGDFWCKSEIVPEVSKVSRLVYLASNQRPTDWIFFYGVIKARAEVTPIKQMLAGIYFYCFQILLHKKRELRPFSP
jgi:hypothetical protein